MNIKISSYSPAHHEADLLRLLLELQSKHFSEVASPDLRELDREVDIRETYARYMKFLHENHERDWKIFVAQLDEKIIGFIIGQIEKDDDLVEPLSGIFEDWFVEPEYRKQGVGYALYHALENWFREKGCAQIKSEKIGRAS